MDIVPVDDELIIETRIYPDDIDVVHPGLPRRCVSPRSNEARPRRLKVR